jgi:diaminopimelate decarboxylase
MASNYNRLPIPGVLLVNEGRYDWIVLPQDYEDLLRNDRIPDYLLNRGNK